MFCYVLLQSVGRYAVMTPGCPPAPITPPTPYLTSQGGYLGAPGTRALLQELRLTDALLLLSQTPSGQQLLQDACLAAPYGPSNTRMTAAPAHCSRGAGAPMPGAAQPSKRQRTAAPALAAASTVMGSSLMGAGTKGHSGKTLGKLPFSRLMVSSLMGHNNPAGLASTAAARHSDMEEDAAAAESGRRGLQQVQVPTATALAVQAQAQAQEQGEQQQLEHGLPQAQQQLAQLQPAVATGTAGATTAPAHPWTAQQAPVHGPTATAGGGASGSAAAGGGATGAAAAARLQELHATVRSTVTRLRTGVYGPPPDMAPSCCMSTPCHPVTPCVHCNTCGW